MTRDDFIAKIENPDDVKRIMARVDEGIKLMNYTDATKIAEWYDRCANLYDQSMLPSTIEGVPDMVTTTLSMRTRTSFYTSQGGATRSDTRWKDCCNTSGNTSCGSARTW